MVVTDGDTIRIDGERIRFSGIDAPELKQTCLYQDIEFQCGEFSKNLLIEKIANQNVNCVRESTDQYGRTLAECFIGQESLSRFLVRAGYAFAYRKYSKKFIKTVYIKSCSIRWSTQSTPNFYVISTSKI